MQCKEQVRDFVEAVRSDCGRAMPGRVSARRIKFRAATLHQPAVGDAFYNPGCVTHNIARRRLIPLARPSLRRTSEYGDDAYSLVLAAKKCRCGNIGYQITLYKLTYTAGKNSQTVLGFLSLESVQKLNPIESWTQS
jgi:hypothetical protein